MSKLTVYSASAGSGKTFTLSAEYISKLISGDPDAANHILAVTFTNKATAEMKTRILQHLYDIGYINDPADKDRQSFFDKVKKLTGGNVSDDKLRQRARAALGYILHNYERFSVQTIDAFLQSTLQYVARELGQTANYAVDIDDKRVIAQAVDDLLQGINDGKAEKDVKTAVEEMMREKMADNKDWNVTRDLNDFARNLSKEVYMRYSDDITKSIEDDKRRQKGHRLEDVLRKMRDGAKKAIKDAADAAVAREADIAKMSNGQRNYFARCRNLAENPDGNIKTAFSDSFRKCAEATGDDVPQVLLKKGDLNNDEMVTLAMSVHEVLRNVFDVYQANVVAYNSANAVLRHLKALGLLNAINANVEAINRENNRIMLSRTPLLFDRLHAGSEASFVFEKAGVRYDHVMIDEFQDTSRLQWENFKKLLIESASNDKDSLLVGDVKQSIYRWRNGDWGILANIKGEVCRNIQVVPETLKTNFRSRDNIVRFNYVMSEYLAKQFDKLDEGAHPGAISDKVYHEVEQECKPKEGGYVSVAVTDDKDCWHFGTEKPDSPDGKDGKGSNAEEEMLEDMARQIRTLHVQGHRYKGMAVLVRTNKQGQAVLKYFAAHHSDVKMISNEAYTLAASPAVELLRALLRLLCEERNSVACSYVAEQYSRKYHKTDFDEAVLQNIKTDGIRALKDYLPEGYLDSLDMLRHIPLYECCERLISLFRINEMDGQAPYIYAFLDDVIAYMSDTGGDLYAYLTYLDDTIEGKSISSGTGDGIEIMTIHKSKGLAFDTVFLPYCNWPVTVNDKDTLWIDTKDLPTPFSTFPLLPVKAVKELDNSVFCNAYREENFQARVDALNTFYVAVTRARHNLFVWSLQNPRSKDKSINKYIAQFVKDSGKLQFDEEKKKPDDEKKYYCDLFAMISSTARFSEGQMVMGDPVIPGEKAEKEEKAGPQNPLDFREEPLAVAFETIDARMSFRQSNESQRFLSDGEDAAGAIQDGYIDRGKLLHAVFAGIYTAADVAASVDALRREGLIASKKDADEIAAFVGKRISEGQPAEWFDGTWTIFNESAILQRTDGSTLRQRRPDRVMTKQGRTVVVDFKFGKQRLEYENQVKEYMDLLRSLGHRDVQGYLWYVYKGEVVRVDS